jgi:hypothetical protein
MLRPLGSLWRAYLSCDRVASQASPRWRIGRDGTAVAYRSSRRQFTRRRFDGGGLVDRTPASSMATESRPGGPAPRAVAGPVGRPRTPCVAAAGAGGRGRGLGCGATCPHPAEHWIYLHATQPDRVSHRYRPVSGHDHQEPRSRPAVRSRTHRLIEPPPRPADAPSTRRTSSPGPGQRRLGAQRADRPTPRRSPRPA